MFSTVTPCRTGARLAVMPEAVPSTSFATVLFRDGNNTGIEVPEAALDAAGATAAWDALSYSKRKEHARSVTEAKKPETRARRVEMVVAKLA